LSVGSIIRSLLFLSWFIVSFCCGVRLENVGVIFLLCVTASVMACSKSSSCASVLEEAGGVEGSSFSTLRRFEEYILFHRDLGCCQ
jgi:hypothetical protein